MSLSTFNEEFEPRPQPRPVDAVSTELGSAQFVQRHRFAELYISTPMGRSPRLPVSRYYWDLNPPVVVDFRSEIKHGQAEVEAKQAYCAARGIRYVLAVNEWDSEVVRLPAPLDDDTPGGRPKTAPSRRR